ncbi:hypothetical protein NP493_778g03037 [Ridgeia piscesae]|uniref:Uncharacterized protein n=1 Tax=Ridgeia piscesae TaxID=27915 RepID=A0AAD9KNH5_RIDPI|nr:hypothetical protein NP493_778g03037 [Ridgeia piscesae]
MAHNIDRLLFDTGKSIPPERCAVLAPRLVSTPSVAEPQSSTPSLAEPQSSTLSLTKPRSSTPSLTNTQSSTLSLTKPRSSTPSLTNTRSTTLAERHICRRPGACRLSVTGRRLVALSKRPVTSNADVYCFRHFLPDKQLCKGVATRRHYAHAHSCCQRARGGGFAVKLERTPKRKNRYVCSPCSHLLDTEKRQSRTRHKSTGVYTWGEWGACSKTCEAGIRTRRARCMEPPCLGPGWQTTVCQLQPHCHVNGQWGMWSPWQRCSVTCGTGMRQRTRACNNPTPRHGGKACEGREREEKSCFKRHCPASTNPWRVSPLTRGVTLSGEEQQHAF